MFTFNVIFQLPEERELKRGNPWFFIICGITKLRILPGIWIGAPHTPLNHGLEQALSIIPLSLFLWLSSGHSQKFPLPSNRLISALVSIVNFLFHASAQSQIPSPILPIVGSLSLQPWLEDPVFINIASRGKYWVMHFLYRGKWPSHSLLQTQFLSGLSLWRCTKLYYYQPSSLRKHLLDTDETEFKQLCSDGNPIRHFL